MMDEALYVNAQLDYIEFQIFPSQNRYDAFVCYEHKKEKVPSGVLEHLLLYLPEVKALHSKGSNAKYKLNVPENTHDVKWFTKSTLIRFLHIIGSSNILDITGSVQNEISQLEEARRFHLSLYAKGAGQVQSCESGYNGPASTPKAEGPDASKNKLLRAIELRLTALKGELTTAFDQVTGSRLRVQEMVEIKKFSDHIGSTNLRDSLCKYIELVQKNQVGDYLSSDHFLEKDIVGAKEGNNQNIESCSLETPVKYGVSPAKVAQVERQSSTGSEQSSFSSEEEQLSVERSRSLIRSASPRRSASPMRRVQIGRSGSRRSAAITIKSLNNFPVRERPFLPQDSVANDSDEGGSVLATKKGESNVNRISVKDAINLFERKQGDQILEIQTAKSLLTASTGASKSVLRRWSSGIGEDSSSCPQDVVSKGENPHLQNDLGSSASGSPKVEAEPSVSSDYHPIKPSGLDVKLNSPENMASSPLLVQEETLQTESTNVSEKVTASAEWSRQKEAELNELLMKMMETKPVQSRNVAPVKSKRQSLPDKQRGGLYDHYKDKRDEKLRRETATNRAEKDKQFKAMQKVLDASKSRLASASTTDASKKLIANKVQKSQKNIAHSQPANPKTERPKHGVVKNVATKTSSLPATRKSWPSIPSPRAPGGSPAKTPVSTRTTTVTGTTSTRRKSQPPPPQGPQPASRSSSKINTSESRAKPVKSNLDDSKKPVRSVDERKQLSTTKPTKTSKSKVQSTSEDSTSAAKPSLYTKVIKKGSVVPVESKPFLHKGSKILKTKAPSIPQDPTMKPNNVVPVAENETASNSSDPVILHQESETKELTIDTVMDPETSAEIPEESEAGESFGDVKPTNSDAFDRVLELDLKADIEEESTISPTAWVEIEEYEDQAFASSDHLCQAGSPTFVAPIGGSSPHVRHSLSQMLLQESSEPDIIDWGNAENPPTMIYQKDAPKGLKRLLKFARKSKTDTNSTGRSSPSVFSEGEDDIEDSRPVSKRNAENLLKKATLQSKNNMHQKISYEMYRKNSSEYDHHAQPNLNKINVQSLSQHTLEGHASASPTTIKGTRSFFSLSAFKGSK